MCLEEMEGGASKQHMVYHTVTCDDMRCLTCDGVDTQADLRYASGLLQLTPIALFERLQHTHGRPMSASLYRTLPGRAGLMGQNGGALAQQAEGQPPPVFPHSITPAASPRLGDEDVQAEAQPPEWLDLAIAHEQRLEVRCSHLHPISHHMCFVPVATCFTMECAASDAHATVGALLNTHLLRAACAVCACVMHTGCRAATWGATGSLLPIPCTPLRAVTATLPGSLRDGRCCSCWPVLEPTGSSRAAACHRACGRG